MIYLFDRDEKLIKIIRKNACKSVTQKQTLTDTNYVSDMLTAEIKPLPDDILEQSEYIAVPTKEDKRKFHLFLLLEMRQRAMSQFLMASNLVSRSLEKQSLKTKDLANVMLEKLSNTCLKTLIGTLDMSRRQENHLLIFIMIPSLTLY